MGWQDRDWARLDDGELDASYGSSTAPSTRIRSGAWLAVVVSGCATLLFGYLHLGRHAPLGSARTLTVIYGTPVQAADGTRACTAFRSTTAGRWLCAVLDLNPSHLAVEAPPPYTGTCGYLAADQRSGAWTCLSTIATPDDRVPDTQLQG